MQARYCKNRTPVVKVIIYPDLTRFYNKSYFTILIYYLDICYQQSMCEYFKNIQSDITLTPDDLSQKEKIVVIYYQNLVASH